MFHMKIVEIIISYKTNNSIFNEDFNYAKFKIYSDLDKFRRD